MPDGTSQFSLTLHKAIAEIPPADWNACAGPTIRSSPTPSSAPSRTAVPPRRAPAGCRSTRCCATAGARRRLRADVREVAQLRRIRVRPRLGERIRARRRQLLSEAAGRRSVQPGPRSAPPGASGQRWRGVARRECGARRRVRAGLRGTAVSRPSMSRSAPEATGSALRRSRLAAAHRHAVPLGERRLHDVRRFPRRPRLAQTKVDPARTARRARRRAGIRRVARQRHRQARMGRVLRLLHLDRRSQMGQRLPDAAFLPAARPSGSATRSC